MNAAVRILGWTLLVLLFAAPTHAQIAYRAGSSVSAVSTDVQYAGAGGFAGANSGNITAPLPANWQVNDFWLAVIESRDNVAATMPSGWTLLNEASGAGGQHRATLFWKRASAGDSDPPITHTGGGHITAKIVGFRRVDLDQPFDVVNSFTGSAADLTTEAASITTVSRSMLVFTAHIGAYSASAGSLAGSSPWASGALSKQGSSGNGVSLELYYSDMRDLGAQAALTLTHAETGESHGALLALRPDKKLTIARPAAAQVNDVMIAALMSGAGPGTVTAPAGWTLVRRVQNGTASELEVFWKAVGSSEPATYTWNIEAKGGAVLGIQAFSGVDSTNPIHVEDGQNTASSLTHATPSITTTIVNTMLVASHGYLASDTWTPPTGMTETVDLSSYPGPVTYGLSLEMSYVLQASAAATGSKTATASSIADSGHAHLLALRPAPLVQTLYFVHVDHLNTPRLVANQSGQMVWRWDQQEPFGVNAPDESPSGLGVFEFSLRFPGQYADRETNLHYNYFRDYDASLGTYKESDPIGLLGGLNTYAYVEGSPVQWMDYFGLCRIEVRFKPIPGGAKAKLFHGYIVTTAPTGGTPWFFRGGPGGPRNMSSPIWGTIQTTMGPYTPGTPDWDPTNPPSVVVLDNDEPCTCYNQSFTATLANITSSNITYMPGWQNSNSVVGTALSQAGFSLPTIPVTAPGFMNNLSRYFSGTR